MPQDNDPTAEAGPLKTSALLTPDVAAAALEFLRRTDLKGAEVDVFLRVRVALETAAMRGGE